MIGAVMGWQRALSRTYLFAFFFVAGYSTVFGVTRYVSNNGGITPPYTSWETAALFFELAHDLSVDGDTIIFDSGEFQFTGEIHLNTGLTLIGQGPESTVLVGRPSMETLFGLPDSTVCEEMGFIGNGSVSAFRDLYPVTPTVLTVKTNCRFADLCSPVQVESDFGDWNQNCWFEVWGEGAAIDTIDRQCHW